MPEPQPSCGPRPHPVRPPVRRRRTTAAIHRLLAGRRHRRPILQGAVTDDGCGTRFPQHGSRLRRPPARTVPHLHHSLIPQPLTQQPRLRHPDRAQSRIPVIPARVPCRTRNNRLTAIPCPRTSATHEDQPPHALRGRCVLRPGSVGRRRRCLARSSATVVAAGIGPLWLTGGRGRGRSGRSRRSWAACRGCGRWWGTSWSCRGRRSRSRVAAAAVPDRDSDARVARDDLPLVVRAGPR